MVNVKWYGKREGLLDMTADPSLDYYLVLAKCKLGVVLEQGYQRAGDDIKLQSFGPVVLDLMKSAAELASSTDFRG